MERVPVARVKGVCEGSIAQEAGIEVGDIIQCINHEMIHDILAYKFLMHDQDIELEVFKKDGTLEVISIFNEDYEDLGIIFENPLIDKAKFCSNQCVFCFIDQLPKNMRETLYFKDDDARLSFLQGNYVTLTNMTKKDIERIVKYRLSPINISVHTTDENLREKMLGNPKAKNINGYMHILADAGITMNCQIVLCRDFNEGVHLDKTLSDLCKLYPAVNSISVVPVGLTKYRQNLCMLKKFDKQASDVVIAQVNKWQQKMQAEHGTSLVFLADEFYIQAQASIPTYEHYEDFPQIENGVGLIASMKKEVKEALEDVKMPLNMDKEISVITGIAAKNFIQKICNQIMQQVQRLKIHVYAIENIFFGEDIMVAGLLTGNDIIHQLQNKTLGSEILIPCVMLKSDKDVFLDDVTVDQLAQKLNTPVTVVDNNGYAFVRQIIQNAVGM